MRDRRLASRSTALLIALSSLTAITSCAAPVTQADAGSVSSDRPGAEPAATADAGAARIPATVAAGPLDSVVATAPAAPDRSDGPPARAIAQPVRRDAVTRSGARGARSVSPPANPHAVAYATSVIAPLSSDGTLDAARRAYEAGRIHVGRQEWPKAEAWFREALRLDAAHAAYHAALGSVMMMVERWPEAEAAYSAAVLLDLDNAEYRRMLKQARSHR